MNYFKNCLSKINKMKKYRNRFLNSNEIKEELQKLRLLLQEQKINKALKLFNVICHYSPYNIDISYEFACYYAKQNNVERVINYLTKVYDINPEYFDNVKNEQLFSKYINSDDFKDIKEGKHSRTWHNLDFRQIEPVYSAYNVSLHFDTEHKEKIAELFLSFDEQVLSYFWTENSFFTHECIDFLDYVSHFVLESHCDISHVNYERLYLAVKSLSPFLKDVHFLISGECLLYMDEIIIDNGSFYAYRHQLKEAYTDEELRVLEKLVKKYPDDTALNKFLSYEYADCAKFEIKEYKVQKKYKEYEESNISIKEAKKYLQKAFYYYPENPEAFYQQAKFYCSLGKNSKARKYYLQCVNKAPKHFDALYDFGVFEFKQENYQKAIDYLTKVTEKKSVSNEIFYYRGMAYELSGEKNKAENDYKKAVEITPIYNANKLLYYGHKLYNKELYQSALLFYQSVFIKNREHKKDIDEREKKSPDKTFYERKRNEINRTNTNAYISIGVTEDNIGNTEKAVEYYDKALKIKPESITALYNKGLGYQKLNQIKKAEEYYDKALSLDSNYINALNNKAFILLLRKEYQKGLEYAERILKIDKTYVNALLSKGNAYINLKKYKEALEIYKKVIKYEPDSEKGYHGMGCAYSWLKKHKKSNSYYNKALLINPDSSDAYIMLSDIGSNLINTGRYNEALEYLEKAIKINPAYYHPYYCKACMFALTGKNEQALQMIKKTLQLDPSQKESLKNEPDFKSLRDNELFKKLLSI